MDARLLQRIVEKYWRWGYQISGSVDRRNYGVDVVIQLDPEDYELEKKKIREKAADDIQNSIDRNFHLPQGTEYSPRTGEILFFTQDLPLKTIRPMKKRPMLKKFLEKQEKRRLEQEEYEKQQREIEESLFPKDGRWYRKETNQAVLYQDPKAYVRFDKRDNSWRAFYNDNPYAELKPTWAPIGKGKVKSVDDVRRILDKAWSAKKEFKDRNVLRRFIKNFVAMEVRKRNAADWAHKLVRDLQKQMENLEFEVAHPMSMWDRKEWDKAAAYIDKIWKILRALEKIMQRADI